MLLTYMDVLVKQILKNLVIKQKQAIRTIDNANFLAHTPPFGQKIQNFTTCETYEYSKIKLMHSFTITSIF
jgi:hypothetical protein